VIVQFLETLLNTSKPLLRWRMDGENNGQNLSYFTISKLMLKCYSFSFIFNFGTRK